MECDSVRQETQGPNKGVLIEEITNAITTEQLSHEQLSNETLPSESLDIYDHDSNTPVKETQKSQNSEQVLVDTNMRRSERLKWKLTGFKGNSYAHRNHFRCSAVPPTISTKVMKNLGERFCKVSANKISNENLTKKRKPKAAIRVGRVDDESHRAKHQEKKPHQKGDDKKSKKPKKK